MAKKLSVSTIERNLKRLGRSSNIWLTHLSQPKQPERYIFHHIPKCGGTSAREALSHWFVCLKDYQETRKPKNLNSLREYHILCGHYHFEGYHLYQRYPEALSNDNCRLITFLRDPLELQISLHYYEHRTHRYTGSDSLEKRLLLRPNYIANRFPCDESNYKEVLDRYFFVGFIETYQTSFNQLADLLQKPRIPLTTLNISPRANSKLSSEFISEFKDLNRLDYEIYDYCKTRYQ